MIQFIYWICIAASLGFIEAIMFHICDFNKLRLFNKDYKDIHVFFTLQRAMIYIAMFTSIRHLVLLAIPCIMIFPFFHDGVYYYMRNKFLPGAYLKGFFDNPSHSTTAKTQLTFKQRAWLAVGGLIVFLLVYFSRFY
jgi:hypothetical protein